MDIFKAIERVNAGLFVRFTEQMVASPPPPSLICRVVKIEHCAHNARILGTAPCAISVPTRPFLHPARFFTKRFTTALVAAAVVGPEEREGGS